MLLIQPGRPLLHHLILYTCTDAWKQNSCVWYYILIFAKELLLYDNLIPDLFNVPANFGGPTVLETSFDWFIFEPECTVEKFSEETGVPVEMVEKYWKRFQILAALDEEDRNIRGVALEWLRQNPNGFKHKFAQELGAAVKMGKYLPNEDDPFPDNEEHKRLDSELVKAWFDKNPDGKMKQCALETGTSYYFVRELCKADGRLSVNEAAEAMEPVVEEWLRGHPNEKVSVVIEKFGVSKSLVIRVRRKIKYGDDGRTIRMDSVDLARKCALWMFRNPDGDIEECAGQCGLTVEKAKDLKPYIDVAKDEIDRLSEWISEHPRTYMERCIKESGINRGTVSFAWKELGGADYAAVQAESAKEITGRIRKWIEGHGEFPSIEECSKDLGVCNAVVSKHWVAAGGNKRSASDIRSEHRIIAMTNWLIEHPDASYDKCAEALEDIGTTSNSIAIITAKVKRVARWRSANPDGTPEDCSRELGMTLRRVVNIWPSATIWMEHMM